MGDFPKFGEVVEQGPDARRQRTALSYIDCGEALSVTIGLAGFARKALI